MYDLGLLQNATTMVGLVDFTQSVTEGLFIMVGMIALFFIMLLNLLRYGFARAMISSCFVCFILSAFLSYMDLFPVLYVFVFVFLLVGSILWFQFHPEA